MSPLHPPAREGCWPFPCPVRFRTQPSLARSASWASAPCFLADALSGVVFRLSSPGRSRIPAASSSPPRVAVTRNSWCFGFLLACSGDDTLVTHLKRHLPRHEHSLAAVPSLLMPQVHPALQPWTWTLTLVCPLAACPLLWPVLSCRDGLFNCLPDHGSLLPRIPRWLSAAGPLGSASVPLPCLPARSGSRLSLPDPDGLRCDEPFVVGAHILPSYARFLSVCREPPPQHAFLTSDSA